VVMRHSITVAQNYAGGLELVMSNHFFICPAHQHELSTPPHRCAKMRWEPDTASPIGPKASPGRQRSGQRVILLPFSCMSLKF